MEKKDYAEKRKELRNQLTRLQLDILDSPSVDKWLKDANPVDRKSFVGRFGKVMGGAMELLWIAENNYIWEPEPGCDIHLAKGEMIRKIADFDVLKPTLGVFDNPFVKCNLIEKAANVSALINLDDAQDRVWMRFNEMAGYNPKSNTTEASKAILSPDYMELFNCFNPGKVNPHELPAFVDFIKKHRQGKAIDMARIAYILKKTGVLCQPKMGWAKWYGIFCERCGIEPSKTYEKDSKKVGIDGMPIKRLWDELNQTMFIKGGRGDALNKPRVGFHDGHQY